MADYSKYQGPSAEWQEFTKTTHVPPAGPAEGQSIEEYQRATNAGREQASARTMQNLGLREKVLQRDFEFTTRDGSSSPVRLYRPIDVSPKTALPLYVFFHGGGFLFGTLASEDARCSKIAVGTGVAVLNVCYRHTPSFKYPTQHHDASDALEWAFGHAGQLGVAVDRIIVGGISSGGNLAASVTLNGQIFPQRDRVKGQILCIPSLIAPSQYPFHLLASEELSSYHQNLNSPILPKKQRDMFHALLDAKSSEEMPYTKYEVQGVDLTGMPPTAFLVAGMDALRDEALLYAEKLQANNVPTHVHIFPGVPHGFHRYEQLSATRRWEEVINESIQWILSDAEDESRQHFRVECDDRV